MAGLAFIEPADVGGAAGFLAELGRHNPLGRGPLAVDRIVCIVAGHFGLTPGVLTSASREKTISTARALAMYVARQHSGMSYPELGRAFGNKNHSTVIAACQRVEALRHGGELICWQSQGEVHHQSAADLLHELEAAVRRGR